MLHMYGAHFVFHILVLCCNLEQIQTCVHIFIHVRMLHMKYLYSWYKLNKSHASKYIETFKFLENNEFYLHVF